MKVLMLGWEFPPHISGGLGTACHGLVGGLTRQGVEVCFVVPRAYGDEAEGPTEILGCNRTPFRTRRLRSRKAVPGDPMRAGGPATETLSEGEEEASGESGEEGGPSSDKRIEVDSILRPYMDERSYRRALEAWRAMGKGDSLPLVDPIEAERATSAFRGILSRLAPGGGYGWIVEVFEASHYLEFSGRYGPDLLGEVARYAIAVARIAEEREFDVIHAHDWMTYPAGLLAAEVTGKPLVVHMHATEFDRSGENVNERIREIESLGLHGADLVIPVSHYTASILRRRYGVPAEKIRVVHNAVTHKEQQDITGWRKVIPEPIVLFLGRVTFQKGPDYFLEAAAKVVSIRPEVKFVMAGSGDMLPPMVERSARLGLARNVHFTGFLRGKDVERMYAMADLYVMPSVSEPFGISPLEAMALDVPVLVSRQSGVSEVLRNALKTDFWDVDDIANKILALLTYGPLRRQLVEEGREEIRRIHWDTPASKVGKVYEELVG